MLYCPHGSVRSSYESVGEIRFLEITVQECLAIDCLSVQSQSLRNPLSGYTSLGNTHFSYFHICKLKFLKKLKKKKEMRPGQPSVQTLPQQQQHY